MMKVTLFRGFDDAYRRSMTLFADSLLKAFGECTGQEENIRGFSPFPQVSSPKALRYVCQYGIYPAEAFLQQGDVNHITDHSYAHLLYTLPHRKTIVTFHDAIWLKTRHGSSGIDSVRKMRWIRAFNLKALRFAARIICDSEASRRALLHYIDYPLEKTDVIPLGLHESFLNPMKRPAPEIPGAGEDPVLLHVGHTQDYKNIPALFHVLALLKKQGCPARLLKAGTAFTPEQEKSARELGVWDRVKFLGKVDQINLPAVYRSAGVLLQPSFDEGFCFPVLEAMACGIPVVASNRGSLPELAGDACVLADPEDYAGMASAVRRIFNDAKLRAQMAEKGKKRAVRYSWKETARRMLEVYRSVFNETKRGD